MVNNHYRWDFIGLSTDTKPTPQTSEKVVDGSTFYTSDDSKFYVWCKDQWYEKTVEGGGGGGTSNFNQLTNRPKFNGVTMTGDTDIPEDFKVLTDDDVNYTDPDSQISYIALWLLPSGKYTLAQDATVDLICGYLDASDVVFPVGMTGANEQPIVLVINEGSETIFTITTTETIVIYYVDIETGVISSYYDYHQDTFDGTDGETDGVEGLVPAPTTDDVNKFLKSDGTWASAGGDAFTELTSADYNYPTENPDGVAVWLLPLGLYKFADGSKLYLTSSASYIATTANPYYLGVLKDNVNSILDRKFIIQFAYSVTGTHPRTTMEIYSVSHGGISSDYGTSYVLRGSDIYNALNQTNTGWALDAYQGKILDDKITALAARVTALEGN